VPSAERGVQQAQHGGDGDVAEKPDAEQRPDPFGVDEPVEPPEQRHEHQRQPAADPRVAKPHFPIGLVIFPREIGCRG